jgi:glucokinase
MNRSVVGVDVGGTKIAAAVVDEHGAVAEAMVVPTRQGDVAALVDQVVETVRTLVRSASVPIEAVGIGVPGIVDRVRGVAVVAANLPWRETPLAEIVADRTGLTTIVANDADAAALAEGRFGAAAGLATYACITVGTGVGCGVVLHGRLLHGGARSGVELGHVIVDPAGRTCRCGSRGCLETTVAGPALAMRYVEAGGAPTSTPGLIAAAAAGDPLALGVLEDAGADLALAVHNLWRLIPLERLVLAGGVANAGDLLLGPLVRQLARIGGRRPVPAERIVVSSLLNRTSALSAAAAALDGVA